MIKSVDELMESVRAVLGEETSDEALSLIEDVKDTVTDLKTKAEDTTNWQQKFKDNDAEWRQKYRDRFFSSESGNEPEKDDEEDSPMVKFEDLFKEG